MVGFVDIIRLGFLKKYEKAMNFNKRKRKTEQVEEIVKKEFRNLKKEKKEKRNKEKTGRENEKCQHHQRTMSNRKKEFLNGF